MQYRFIGRYTGGNDTVTLMGVTFHGREPSDVTDPVALRKFAGHRELEPVDADGDGQPDDRKAITAELKALGVSYFNGDSTEKLAEKLSEARAKAQSERA